MSLTVSNLSKAYYNIYALTSSDTYKDNEVNSSEVSQSKYNVSDINNALDMLSVESNFSTLGSVSSYATDMYKLSQVDATSSSDSTSSLLSLLSGDTDFTNMYSIIDTSGSNTEKLEDALGTSISSAISAYSGTSETYEQYLSEQSSIDLLL